MEKPLVTIAITVYNGAKFISWPLESSINQTYQNLDIVVLDDMSTDNTEEIVKNYISKDKRIRYIQNETNIGYARSLLKLAELAKGEFIQLLGGDDWLSRDYIEKTLKEFEDHPNAACIATEIITLRANEKDFDFLNTYFPCQSLINKSKYLRKVYKTALATLTAFAFFRKADFLESAETMNGFFTHPPFQITEELQKLHFKGFATETLFLLSSIYKYDYFVITNQASYVKTQHFENENKPYAKNVDWVSAGRIFQWYEYTRIAYEYLFKTSYKKNLFGFRVFFGSDPFISIFVMFLKNKNKNNFFNDLNLPRIKKYFADYSTLEIIISLLWIPFRLIFRILFSLLRKIFGFTDIKNKRTNVFQSNLFLSSNQTFQS